MEIYKVGGAVRDALLGLEIQDTDWVAVGACADDLLKQGFKQVGRDFPVFLHPKTKEEYALARTERKQAAGHLGFVCDTSLSVTLEDDLKRRDLTINAMAMDDSGNIIDPYGGQEDIQLKQLRHVSEAFIEDPLRVFRVARFAARFAHLGFSIAPETLALMAKMVRTGELKKLSAERVWQECTRALAEKNPDIFFMTLRRCDALRHWFFELDNLFGVPQSTDYHPEIDTGMHTMAVLQQAVSLSRDVMVRFAALVHDLGKATTPIQLWPKHSNHAKDGVKPISDFCSRLKVPRQFLQFAKSVSLWHTTVHKLYSLSVDEILNTLEALQGFKRRDWFENALIVCTADARGRGRFATQEQYFEYPQASDWRNILDACSTVTGKSILAEGYPAEQVRDMLYLRRKKIIQDIRFC